jgi:tetratricopeptide (TPR) repeat protein
MKKSMLVAVFALALSATFAQKLEKAKDLLKTNKIAEAKAEIDKVLADAKNEKNAEAYYTKAKILNAIAADKTLSAATPDAGAQAFEAIKKYVSLDEKQLLLTLENYKPMMEIYTGFYKTGAAFYNDSKHAEAYQNFKQCLAVGEYMAQKKWTNVTMDTNVILYAGITSERSDKKDEAAGYYAKLANAKVADKGMVEIYKWLAAYFSEKKDDESAMKYLQLGKEIFPKDSAWENLELILITKKGDKKLLFEKYESIIAKNPTDYQTLYNYGVEKYVYAYNPEPTKRPAGAAEMIDNAETNLKKVVQLKPDYVNAQLLLGQIAFNKGVDFNNQLKTIKPPANGKLKPEDLKKKEDLRTQAGKKFDEAIPYFEKVDQLLGSKGKLHAEEKKTLKDAYDLLIMIYDSKKKADKVKVYEEKFNAVEKVH